MLKRSDAGPRSRASSNTSPNVGIRSPGLAPTADSESDSEQAERAAIVGPNFREREIAKQGRIRRVERVPPGAEAGSSGDVGVVRHDHRAVTGNPDVKFESRDAEFDRSRERGQRVLGSQAARAAVTLNIEVAPDAGSTDSPRCARSRKAASEASTNIREARTREENSSQIHSLRIVACPPFAAALRARIPRMAESTVYPHAAPIEILPRCALRSRKDAHGPRDGHQPQHARSAQPRGTHTGEPDSAQPEGEKALEAYGTVQHAIRLGKFHGVDDAYTAQRFGAEFWGFEGGSDYALPAPSHILREGGDLPIPDADLFVFREATGAEGCLLLRRGGGLLASCDSVQHWESTSNCSPLAKVVTYLMGFVHPRTSGHRGRR